MYKSRGLAQPSMQKQLFIYYRHLIWPSSHTGRYHVHTGQFFSGFHCTNRKKYFNTRYFLESLSRRKTLHKGSSINDIGNFSAFLTPPSPCRQFFSTICRQFLTPSLLPIANIIYGRPLSHSQYRNFRSI